MVIFGVIQFFHVTLNSHILAILFFTSKHVTLSKEEKTRPDTRPSVADGWAGAFSHFSTRGYGPTNQRTDGRTDKASYRVACPQLKRLNSTFIRLSSN